MLINLSATSYKQQLAIPVLLFLNVKSLVFVLTQNLVEFNKVYMKTYTPYEKL